MAIFDLDKFRNAVGIGMKAIKAGFLNMGLPVDMNGKRIIRVADPVDLRDAATKQYVDTGGERHHVSFSIGIPYGFYGVGIMVNSTLFRFNLPINGRFPTGARLRVNMSGTFRVQISDGSGTERIFRASGMSVHGYCDQFVTLNVTLASAAPNQAIGIIASQNDSNARIDIYSEGVNTLADYDFPLLSWEPGNSDSDGETG